MYSLTNVEHINRRCNWHQAFVLLSIAEHSISNWHSTGVHEDWHAANVPLLRQIYEWAAGVGDRAVTVVFVPSWDFLFLVLRLVFLRPCGWWSVLRLFLVAFYSFVTCIFLVSTHETDYFLTLFIILFLPQVVFSKVV